MLMNDLSEYKNVRFPESCKGFIDVTKEPYYADNTGEKDCTEILVGIINGIMQKQLEAIRETKKKLASAMEETIAIAFENKKIDGEIERVIFPETEPQIPIMYFPNGVYLVSDTISYSIMDLQNECPKECVGGFELNRYIMMMGQSRAGTVIKLKDNCPGFEYGNERPVVSYMRGERSNVAWNNYFENITIDVGSGNPGAVGLVFFGNNSGAVRNVTIRSSDPHGFGAVGFAAIHEIISGCCVRNLSVEGFDIGIKVTPTRNYVAFSNVCLKGQRKYGIKVEQTIASFHNVYYKGNVPALYVSGALANVVLTDAKMICPSHCIYPAIKIELGYAFIRNIVTKNFASSINMYWGEKTIPDGSVKEFSTHEGFSLFDERCIESLNLPCQAFPDQDGLWDIDHNWVCVNDFGAKGDGETDDTAAVQRAMQQGGTIWFQPGCYLLTEPIEIPTQVLHVHFMNCEFAISENRHERDNDAVFCVTGDDAKPLLLEKLSCRHLLYGHIRLVRHEGKRTLHMRDIHTQCSPSYYNTVSGATLFLEDVVSTTSIKPYRHLPAFHFIGQKVYAFCINPERSMHEIINDGGAFWLMGFKTEGDGPLCETYNGGKSDILGGTISIGSNNTNPIILNHESDVSAVLATNGYGSKNIFPIAVEEIRNGDRAVKLHNELPQRFSPFYRLPLYIGHASGKKRKRMFELY